MTMSLHDAGHAEDLKGPLFRPVKSPHQDAGHAPASYVRLSGHRERYAREAGLADLMPGLCVHSLCATTATNALAHHADVAKVQEWLRHSDISTTPIYDTRHSRTEDNSTFTVQYCKAGNSKTLSS